MSRRIAEALAERAAVDLRAAETLGPCSDIDDAVIGFYAQQMVEKSLKVALALGDVGFQMMEHDLDFLLTLAANGDIEIPTELTRATWLTAWGTTYENGEASPGRLDRQEAIEIGAAAVSWCANLVGQRDPQASGVAVQGQESFRKAQAAHWPEEDLSPYMGRWIAVRDGKVIASDLSLSSLRSQPEVKPSDVFMPVPRTRAGYFIA